MAKSIWHPVISEGSVSIVGGVEGGIPKVPKCETSPGVCIAVQSDGT